MGFRRRILQVCCAVCFFVSCAVLSAIRYTEHREIIAEIHTYTMPNTTERTYIGNTDQTAYETPPNTLIRNMINQGKIKEIVTMETLAVKISEYLGVKRVGPPHNNSKLVIGIPSVRRENEEMYVMETISSLLSQVSENDKQEILIIVFIAEPNNYTYVWHLMQRITTKYSREFNSGLVEIIYPEPELYPDLSNLKPSYGDTKSRIFWRSKETLDAAILCLYAMSRGRYFLFLEDDVIAKSNYFNGVETFISEQKSDEWLAAKMSDQSKAILFKCEKLWMIIDYLLLFYQDKPVDWLISDFFSQKTCEISPKDCSHRFLVPYNVGLFKHIGKVSTLSEKNNREQ